MSGLSGYDSEAVGFDSVAPGVAAGRHSATQTCDYDESGAATQTALSSDTGCTANSGELAAEDDVLPEHPPPGLNEFLRNVVPGMMEQLNQNDREMLYNSSDSDDEEPVVAKLLQETEVEARGTDAGDHPSTVLAVTWSCAGSSLAVSVGRAQHETWCSGAGLIRVYVAKRAVGDRLVHALDIAEKSCVTALRYHPAVAALLAYGTAGGEVVLYSSAGPGAEGLASPAGCHGSRRVAALRWADAQLANAFLAAQAGARGRRRGAGDQVLVSAGCDGTVNVWQVNADMKTFENIVCCALGAGRRPPPDITCLDFIKRHCLRSYDEKVAEDVFVVGSKSGALYVCGARAAGAGAGAPAGAVDPVRGVLQGHAACVLGVEFSPHRPGVFVSVSIDSELRLYNVNQTCPLKVFCLDVAVSCMSWLGSQCVLLGLAGGDKGALRVYGADSGRPVPVEGFVSDATVCCLAVSQSGIAAGHADNRLRVWEVPLRRIRLTSDDTDF